MSDMWDSVAPDWEANADFVNAHLATATQMMLDAAAIGAGDAVLDLAAGPGGAGLAAAERVGPDGRVMLADVAPAMVAVAARRAGGHPNVSTAVFDQSAILAPDESFHAIIIRHGLMFADGPVGAVSEAVRVLTPGRRYAAMTWDERERNPWLGVVLDAVGEQFGVPFPPANLPGPFSLATAPKLTSVFEQAGLEDVSVQAVSTPMHSTSLEEWWARVPRLAGPLAMALAGMEPDVREAIAARALEYGARAAQTDPDGIVLAGSVLITSGRKPRG